MAWKGGGALLESPGYPSQSPAFSAGQPGNPMRLTCPNCSARYEVDDSLIPPEGRDVQCSNCATTWFQPGNRARADEPEGAAPRPAPRRDLDPALRDILREEREREEQLRRAAAPVEEQEEMALDSPAPPARASEPETDEAEEDAEAAAIREMVEEDATGRDRRHSGRDLLPDIEEINSTLRATTDRHSGDFSTSDIDSMDRRPRRRRGVRLGFLLVMLVSAAGIAAYAYAPEITTALPQAEPWLVPYVAQVNELRFWLDDVVQSLLGQLSELAAG